MKRVIGAHHEFHDEGYVLDWAERFRPTPDRRELFALMCLELEAHVRPDGCIVELGIGPGYLAEHVLGLWPRVRYVAIDFSEPMLAIARKRLSPYGDRVHYIRADLTTEGWWTEVKAPVEAIVSTWALHDLGSQDCVATVYAHCASLLMDDGLLLNGDFVKPDEARHAYEPGRFDIATHLQLLGRAGFTQTACLGVLEQEIESPTAAQNYACFRGVIAGCVEKRDAAG